HAPACLNRVCLPLGNPGYPPLAHLQAPPATSVFGSSASGLKSRSDPISLSFPANWPERTIVCRCRPGSLILMMGNVPCPSFMQDVVSADWNLSSNSVPNMALKTSDLRHLIWNLFETPCDCG